MSDRLGRRGDVAAALLLLALVGIVVAGLMSRGGPPRDRAADLERRLRCPVCKTVSIADSPSQTAATARQVVREQVAAGRSDAEVLAYFRQRYGEWILLDPAPVGRNLLLWGAPVAAAAVGVVLLGTTRRPQSAGATAAPGEVREELERRLADLRAGAGDEDDGP